jgi:hypothetical protein
LGLAPASEEQDISVEDKNVTGTMDSDFAHAAPLFGLGNIEDTSVPLLKILKQWKHY